MTLERKTRVSDKIIIDFLKVNRLTGEITTRISTETNGVKYRKFRVGDSYTYTLTLDDEVVV